MSSVISVILEVIKSLLIVVAASWVTVRFSLRRFYTEKWWERKAQAYSKVIGSLARMRMYFDRWMEELIEHRVMSGEEKEKFEKEYRLAREVIKNAVAVGSFILSEEAAHILEAFLKQLEEEHIRHDWLKDIERHYGQATECIIRLREIAKKDLRKR